NGPRGALYGPFVPLIRSPELMHRVQQLGEYLRYRSSVGTRLTELAILITSRQWTQEVEWAIHAQIALDAGIKPETVHAIAECRALTGLPEDEQIVYRFCRELHESKNISDATYALAREKFGEQGIIDLMGTCGYYALLAMVMNGAGTAVPDGLPEPPFHMTMR
ncbi:MAG: carboxymuconolactone decarboxylase family protein, partial [Burkholderiales bacterium]